MQSSDWSDPTNVWSDPTNHWSYGGAPPRFVCVSSSWSDLTNSWSDPTNDALRDATFGEATADIFAASCLVRRGTAFAREVWTMAGGLSANGNGRGTGMLREKDVPAPRAPRVLVVDDEPPILRIVDRVLTARGCATVCCHDGLDAAKRLD